MSGLRPLTVDGVVELAVVERGGVVESRHLGAGVVVDATGARIREVGDAGAAIYPRSSLKPLQATAIRRLGVVLDPIATALSAASHQGTRAHLGVVQRMLDGAGLDESDLGCPASWPGDAAAARAATTPRRIAHTCSGKHAGFLTACVTNGWEPGGYLSPGHPLQRRVVEIVEELCGASVGPITVDGCGAPLPLLPLEALARGASAVTGDPDGAQVAEAMIAEPWAVEGRGEATTSALAHGRLLAKVGAEGVFVASTGDGVAVAVKILDGGGRAAALVGLQLLASVGALDPSVVAAVDEESTPRVLGGDEVVGRIRVADALR